MDVDSRTYRGFTAHHEESSLQSEDDSSIFLMEEDMDVKKGPWTDEEDALLANYVQLNGEGRWNSIARFAGLKRTGKSCRLRWLNYLRPDLRRGNITLEEQLIILELHSRWGNRWSKIAKCLPGRTDNEIKNYWRTRVQKQAKQLKCDVNSQEFRDTMRNVWIPQMAERIRTRASSSSSGGGPSPTDPTHVTNPIGSDSIISADTSRVLPPDSDNISTCYDVDHRGISGTWKGEQGKMEEMSSGDMWLDGGGGETTTSYSWESSCFWNDDACFLPQQLSDVDPWWENLLT